MAGYSLLASVSDTGGSAYISTCGRNEYNTYMCVLVKVKEHYHIVRKLSKNKKLQIFKFVSHHKIFRHPVQTCNRVQAIPSTSKNISNQQLCPLTNSNSTHRFHPRLKICLFTDNIHNHSSHTLLHTSSHSLSPVDFLLTRRWAGDVG